MKKEKTIASTVALLPTDNELHIPFVAENIDKYALLFDKAIDGIAIADTETGIVIDCNSALERLVGRTKNEIVGHHQKLLHPPEEWRGRYSASFEAHISTHDNKAIHTVVINSSGEVIPVHITASSYVYNGRTVTQGIFRDVSALVESSFALQQSEHRFSQIAELSQEFIWEIDENAIYRYASNSSFQVTGYQPDELIGKIHLFDLHPEDGREAFRAAELKACRNGNARVDMRRQIVTKEGHKRWISTNCMPITAADGSVTGYRGSDIDITRRAKTEEMVQFRLKLRDRAFVVDIDQLLIEIADAAEHLTDSSSAFIHAVDEASRCLTLQAWSKSTVSGNCKVPDNLTHVPFSEDSIWSTCISLRKTMIQNDCSALLHTNKLPAGHIPLSRIMTVPAILDGKVFYLIAVGNKQHDYGEDDSYLINQLVLYAAELIERKKANISLRQKERYQRALLDNFPFLVWLKDIEGRFLSVNRNFAEIAGLSSADDLIGKNDLDVWPQSLAESYMEADRQIIDSRTSISMEELIHADGVNTVFETYKAPVADLDGKLIGTVGFARDITARKIAESERSRMDSLFQQTQKLESLGVMAGGIAHDFNNILTIIIGHCKLLEMDLSEDSVDCLESVQKIKNAADRAATLCSQMLSYAGKTELVQKSVYLGDAITETVNMLRSMISKNVSIKSEIMPGVKPVSADYSQMEQVIMNLIINAAEAIGDKNGSVLIRLTELVIDCFRLADAAGEVIVPGSYACIEVTDNGTGMSEEVQRKLFEPFYTTKFSGRGLGMSVVRGNVKAHGGRILLESSLGSGTTIKILLPQLQSENRLEEAVLPHQATGMCGGKILLVEDEEQLRKMASRLLSSLGFSVTVAENGVAALDIVRNSENSFDLILLDLIMPVMGGRDFYRQFRYGYPHTPVLICSGFGSEAIMEDIRNDPNAAFISKPYDTVKLPIEIMNLLEKSQ